MGCFLTCFGGAKDSRRRHRQASIRRASPRRDFVGSKLQLLTANESESSLRPGISSRKLPALKNHGIGESLLNFKLECSELEKPLLRSLFLVKHAGEEAHTDSPSELNRETYELGSSGTPQKPLSLSVSPGKPAGEESTAERENDELGSSGGTTNKTLCSSLSPLKPAGEESTTGTEREKQQQGSSGSSGGARKKVTFDLNVQTIARVSYSNELDFNEDEEQDENLKYKKFEGKNSPSSTDFPPNHRYRNCVAGDDEETDNDDEYEDCEPNEDEEEDELGEEEESYESYFSLKLEKEKENSQEVNSPNPCKTPIIPAGHTARDRSQSVQSVLNPIENLSQWREIKGFKTKSEDLACLGTPKSREVNSTKNSENQEISVDASLSSWLSTPPAKSESQRSVPSYSKEDQPILGALTVEDIKQSSVTSSPRRSPGRSADDIPIVGTVGSYWSCTSEDVCDSGSSRSGSELKGIPNTSSKYREDKRVNWHTTPFEVRLERALNNKDKTSPDLSGLRV